MLRSLSISLGTDLLEQSIELIETIPTQELETKLKEVVANGENGAKNVDVDNVVAVGVGGKSVAKTADSVGRRLATKFLAQVDIKEAETGSSKKQQTGNDESSLERKEVREDNGSLDAHDVDKMGVFIKVSRIR